MGHGGQGDRGAGVSPFQSRVILGVGERAVNVFIFASHKGTSRDRAGAKLGGTIFQSVIRGNCSVKDGSVGEGEGKVTLLPGRT